MAKKSSAAKKIKSELKGFIDEYKDKLLLLAVSFFETKAKHVVDWIKDISHLKRKLRAMAVFFSLFVVGLFLIVFGIADYVTYRFPILAYGWGKILVGIIIIVIGYIIKKLS